MTAKGDTSSPWCDRHAIDETSLLEEILHRTDKQTHILSQRLSDEIEVLRSKLVTDRKALVARESVIRNTEESFQKLLTFDEKLQRREKEVQERELQLEEKTCELQKREKELNLLTKQRQREYEARVAPLQAREQTLLQREEDFRLMQSELEQRIQLHMRKMNADEETVRSKEKTVRDLESKARELLNGVDKRQGELDQLANHLQKKQKLLRNEEGELDARERELALREQQLFHGEKTLVAAKQKQSEREQSLSAQQAALFAANSAIETQKSNMAEGQLRYTAAVNKLVDAEGDVKHHEESVDGKIAYCDKMFTDASQKVEEAENLMRVTKSERDKLMEKEENLSIELKRLQEREKALISQERRLSKFHNLLGLIRSDIRISEEKCQMRSKASDQQSIDNSSKRDSSRVYLSRQLPKKILPPLRADEKSVGRADYFNPFGRQNTFVSGSSQGLIEEVSRLKAFVLRCDVLDSDLSIHIDSMLGNTSSDEVVSWSSSDQPLAIDEDSMREVVLLRGAQRDLKNEYNFLFQEIVGEYYGRKIVDDNFDVSDFANFLMRAQSEGDASSKVIWTAFRRCRDIVERRCEWLTSAIEMSSGK